MSGFAFDANIIIDVVAGVAEAEAELRRAVRLGPRVWMSRVAWIEVLSKGEGRTLRDTEMFLARFAIDELDEEIAAHAAFLRRQRPRLKSPDAIILASAQIRGRILVTRNTKDFPAEMPGIRVPYTI